MACGTRRQEEKGEGQMAGRFEVTASELRKAASDLAEKNEAFVSAVRDLELYQQELYGMWEGAANETFNAAFLTDKGKWDTFAQTMTSYIEALQIIAQEYDNAEARNTEIARYRG